MFNLKIYLEVICIVYKYIFSQYLLSYYHKVNKIKNSVRKNYIFYRFEIDIPFQ